MTKDSGFVDRLRRARFANEFSQADLAEAAGIAAAQISRYEAGKNYPRPHVVAKLAKVLGVTSEWLTEDPLQTEVPAEEPTIHIPHELHEHLIRAAAASGRSVNAEAVARLEQSMQIDQATPSLILSDPAVQRIAAGHMYQASVELMKTDPDFKRQMAELLAAAIAITKGQPAPEKK